MNDLDNDLDMEPYFRAWDAQKKAVESLPDMESGIGRALKHGGHRPFRKLLRREVACLIAAVVMLVWLLFNFSKGMEMPVAYLMTLLLMLLCVADSVYALRLIALANPITSSIPDMLKNCARLRLFEKIEILAALVVVAPIALLFYMPVLFWILQSANLYYEWSRFKPQIGIIMTVSILLGVILCLYFYRSNLKFIKGTINELRTYRNQN
ncbi:MAG: hypothetical protein II525_07530 [Bacteroidales bacterium]|nr:hypothetical protein [Bacteroidales bacterium]